MMIYQKTFSIKNNKQLVINLPEKFRTKRRVKVTIEDADIKRKEKIDLIKEASEDPMFLDDVADIFTDFAKVDKESL